MPDGQVARGIAIDDFVADDDRLARDYLIDQDRRGCIRPEWRFAWVDAAGAIGSRVAYWAPPGAPTPMLIDVVYADEAGTVDAVLAASLAALGLDDIEYVASRRHAGERSPRTEPVALEAAGFNLVAIQIRLEHTGPVGLLPPPPGITVSSVAELGYGVLPALIAATQVDSGDRGSRERDPAHALAGLRELGHEPAWWQVALDAATEAPVGFVMPARTGDGGHVIALIGVAPAARGRGLGRFLLAHATATLHGDAGPGARVIADVDETNPAMLHAAAAVGYRPFGTRAHYRRGAGI